MSDDDKLSAITPPSEPPDLETGAQIEAILTSSGLITPEQLKNAHRILGKISDRHSLTKVLLELGYLSQQDLHHALRANRQKVPLGNLLVELGHLTRAELRAALEAQQDPHYHGKRLGEILLEMGLIHEHRLIEVLANQLDFVHEEPSFPDIDRSLLDGITPTWCAQYQSIPVRKEGNAVLVAFLNPLDSAARQAAEAAFEHVIPGICTRRAIESTINSFDDSRKLGRERTPEVNEADATRIIDSLILSALEAAASDIHIEPLRHSMRVRFRCDGVLIVHKEIDKELAPLLTSRLKILAQADIAEKRRHQGGGFRFDDARTGYGCDVRASFFVTIFGEKIVLRLLSRKAELLDIKEVGMAPKMLERFMEDALDAPSGVILVTGPTGSGKTTTLYGCVNYLNDTERSITTAEDPVEYVVEGISQCGLNPKINLTFEESLRHMVRQDPDIIVIGEIRDRFSADSAIQAALTGHKVLSTFHTEDSIGGLLRLMNMQIESFLISSTVVSILAQRLLRGVCPQCAESYQPNAHELQRIGWTQADVAGASFRQGRGCSACHFTGSSGRVGVFELLVLNEMVKDAILNKKTSSEIRRISIETSGLITLLEDGLAKAALGKTSLQEVTRNLPRLGRPRPFREILRLVGNPKT